MKTFLLTLIICLLAGSYGLFGQTFPELNSTWKVQERETNTSNTDTIVYCIEYHIEDSIYKYDKWYKALYCDGPEFKNDTVALIRNEGKKIIARTTLNNRFNSGMPFDTSEYVLYDFSLNVGDSIALKFQGNYYFNNRENEEVFRVVKKDSVQTISGKKLQLKLRFVSSQNSFPISGYTFQAPYGDTLIWIEDIGTPQGFYYPIDGSDAIGFFPDSFLHRLICMHTGGVLTYQKKTNCNCSQNQSLTPGLDKSILIFPNPTQGIFTLSLPEGALDSKIYYEIRSLQGSLIRKEKVTSFDTNVDINTLKKGVYIIYVKTSETPIFTSRLIRH